jgi:hypothetical protein
MAPVRAILLGPVRAFAAALMALFACIRAALCVLRFAFVVGLLAWLVIAIWLAWQVGRVDHLIAVLAIFAVYGWLSQGGSSRPRIWIWYQPSGWHRSGARADLRED